MKADQTRIRLMREEDWQDHDKIDAEIFPDDRMKKNDFLRLVASNRFFALVSEDDQIIGHLFVGPYSDDMGNIGRIGVKKTMQHQGLGTKLMQYAMNWFQNQEGIRKVILYTQDFNVSAQHLYMKFGFQKTGTTWHYFVPYMNLQPRRRYTCQCITKDEINQVGTMYPETMPAPQIHRWLKNDQHILTLKTTSAKIIGACRFTPDFPGCFPFQLDVLDAFDDFIEGIREYSLPEYDYVRVTFTDNLSLAKLMQTRKYKLHHRLHKMEANL